MAIFQLQLGLQEKQIIYAGRIVETEFDRSIITDVLIK